MNRRARPGLHANGSSEATIVLLLALTTGGSLALSWLTLDPRRGKDQGSGNAPDPEERSTDDGA